MGFYLSLFENKKNIIKHMYIKEKCHPFYISKYLNIPLFLITGFLAEVGLLDRKEEQKNYNSGNSLKRNVKGKRNYIKSSSSLEEDGKTPLTVNYVKYGMIKKGDYLILKGKKLLVAEVYQHHVVVLKKIQRIKSDNSKEDVYLRTSYQYKDIDEGLHILI